MTSSAASRRTTPPIGPGLLPGSVPEALPQSSVDVPDLTAKPCTCCGESKAETVIRARGVSRSFGHVRAVDGVDLDVHRGRILALLGPSGCGKTTMLRLLAGFERPETGSVEIEGAVVAGPRTWVPPERRRIGMVFQDYALFPHLTVGDNVGFGLPRRDRRGGSRVREVLELVGLRGLEGRYPAELSGGQQQRVALARALAPAPAVILLDEPFSNLDAALRAQVRSEVHRILAEARVTAVFVTHDQEEALSIADEVAVMDAGRIVQVASPEALYRRPANRGVAAFVGEAEFLEGTTDGVTAETEIGPVLLVEPVPAGPVEVLLRPEDLRLEADEHGHAVIITREFYGHDQMLWLRMDSGRLLRARLGPVSDLAPGTRCRVTVQTPVRAFPQAAERRVENTAI